MGISVAMRAKIPPAEPGTLTDLIRSALGGVIGEAVKAAVDEQLPRALAAMRMPPRPAEPEGDYVRRKRAAQIMGYSKSTVGRLIKKGLLRASGPKLDRVARAEIDRFMAAAARREETAIDEDAALEAEARRIVGDDE